MDSEDGFKDLYIEGGNIVFGNALFLRLKIPARWRIYPIPHRTDVEAYIEVDGVKWVVSGYTGFIIVDEEEGFRQDIYLSVKRGVKGGEAEKYVNEEVNRLNPIYYSRIEGRGVSYYIFEKIRRRHIIFGESIKETIFKAVIDCRDTYRYIILEASIKGDYRDFIKLFKPVLSSVRC